MVAGVFCPVGVRRGLVIVLSMVFMVLLCVCVEPGVARAAFEVRPGSFAVSLSSVRAGAHPDLTESFAITQKESGEPGAPEGLLRNAEVVLPVGFAGYPALVKTCDPVQLQLGTCPVGSQIGTIEAALKYPIRGSYIVVRGGLYNIAPSADQTAVYGFAIYAGGAGSIVTLSGEIVVSVGPDYRVRARATNIFSAAGLVWQSITLWGVPAEPSHDAQRGSEYGCKQFGPSERFVPGNLPGEEECFGGGSAANENAVPYLVNPTQCTSEPLEADLVGMESWEGKTATSQKASMGPFTGCESLKFAPTISVAPEATQATTPTGYEIDLKVPQTEGAEGLATPDLKDAVVKMPVGTVLSPSAATGLESCNEAEVGLHTEQAVKCPPASKLATVSVITPALTGELKGSLYLGGPPSGVITGPPFTVYLTFEGHGVLVKIPGTVTPNPATGQVVTTFDENPELPFSELKLHLNGGSRATLANPSSCGSYDAEADFTPWSSPFTPDATPTSPPFTIVGCGAPRFEPSFKAGTTSTQAGGYSPMSVMFAREDADEDLGGLSVTTPPGLSGDLTGIPLCGEPQAAEGMCPEASLIGEVTAGAGPGPEPVFIKGGRVYLTGPYDGAPFGLSVDVSERAGPLDLGSGPCDCEVVRATVSVNPQTAQLTVTNGALPTGKDGIPFQVKKVNVLIDRPNFVFNPTDCEPLSFAGTLSSTGEMLARESAHFQVTNCAALSFAPQFKVSTSGRTTREDGASLDAKLSYPSAPFGSQTNIALAKVQLPKQLPSRLTTLQKACPAATFEANPAACPAGSRVGVARATTPIIPVPLTGPAYFVSHGGEAFPSLIVVLQGYGVTVDLVGSTFINEKTSITTSTFKTVPDVPVGTFELYLPQGRYSALAAHGNLCKSKLAMPTEFVSQDGTVIRRSTAIAVTGCPKAKARATRASRRTHHAR
jgi:hypothetical protein